MSTLESDTEVETSSAYSDTSSTSTLLSKRSYNRREELPLITDPHKLEQRQKQLDYGKNTDGYRNYLKLWPKINRKLSMPVTPEKSIGYSHRRWLGIMTKWRKALHQWDTMDNPPSNPKSQVRVISCIRTRLETILKPFKGFQYICYRICLLGVFWTP